MKRACLVVLSLALLTRAPALAQGSPAPIKFGKWLLVAGSIGMNLAAASAHSDADSVFGLLNDRCDDDHALCELGTGGVYADAESERLYQATVSYDRRARNWLLGGEAAALGAAVLFVWEFARPKGPPENIPFEPKVSIGVQRTEIGLAVRF
jgi:hypothetical protein